MRHISFHQGIFTCQAHELGMFGIGQDRLAETRNRRESRSEINFLESTRTKYLHIHLPSKRQDRRPVDLGIPQTGHQVSGAWTCYGQAGGRLTSEFCIAGTGHGCR